MSPPLVYAIGCSSVCDPRACACGGHVEWSELQGDPSGFCRLNSMEIRIRQPRGCQSTWDTLWEHCRTFYRIAHFTMRQTRYPWAFTLCLVSFFVEWTMKISWFISLISRFSCLIIAVRKESCRLPVSGFLMLFLICFAESETQKKWFRESTQGMEDISLMPKGNLRDIASESGHAQTDSLSNVQPKLLSQFYCTRGLQLPFQFAFGENHWDWLMSWGLWFSK